MCADDMGGACNERASTAGKIEPDRNGDNTSTLRRYAGKAGRGLIFIIRVTKIVVEVYSLSSLRLLPRCPATNM